MSISKNELEKIKMDKQSIRSHGGGAPCKGPTSLGVQF